MDTKKWNDRFLELATHISSWSKDPSRKVGCVIAKEKHVVSLGYNGFPPGVKDLEGRMIDRATKLKFTQHAERNAIYNAKQSLDGATLYTTLFPCCECAKTIISHGITKVVYRKELENRPGVDYNSDYSKIMFDESGVEIVYQPTESEVD